MQHTSTRAVCAMLVAALAPGCSLLVSTDGLTGGVTAGNDAAPGSAVDAAADGGAADADTASKTVTATTSRTGVIRANGMTPELPATEVNAGSGAGAVSKQTGLRFVDVHVPKGAVIASATIQLVASENQAGPMTNTTLSCEAADNAAPWTGTFADLDGRARGRKIAWTMIEAWAVGEHHETPDLAAALQEVIDRPGWADGNAVVIFWANDGAPANAQRVAYTAGTSTTVDPVLTIRLR